MPFIIDGKTYASIDDSNAKGLTMAEQMMIEAEFKQPIEKLFEGLDLSAKAVKSLSEAKQDELAVRQRQAMFISIWISRRRAGEKLSFAEAIDIELDKFQIVDDTDPKDETIPPIS